METTTQELFAVVQDVYQVDDWQAAATVLTEVLGLPDVSARQQAKRSHGFLATNLPATQAQRLRDACAQRNLAVQVVPQNNVLPLVKPIRVHQLRLADDALELCEFGQDATLRVAWSTLRLIAVTKTTKKETFRHWENRGVDPQLMQLKATAYTDEHTEYLADVFAIQPHKEVLGLRLLSMELNYREALGSAAPDALVEANARTDSFRLLLSLMASRAPQVFIPPESLAFLTRAPRDNARIRPVASLSEFDAYNRWLLQQSVLRTSLQAEAGLR